MIQTGFDSRVKVQDVILNHLPSYILDESPKTVDFLKQYYISQEYQGGPIDISENLDQYLNVNSLVPEVFSDTVTLTEDVSEPENDLYGYPLPTSVINVSSTKGFPKKYGLLKINDEIITYTDKTSNSFLNCIRGFSGITKYNKELSNGELEFKSTSAASHSSGDTVENLSSLFLREFFEKLKFTYLPGFEGRDLYSELSVGNFIQNAKNFYNSKGTDESFRILFNVLYGETPKVVNLEDLLIKPSDASYIRNEVIVVESLSGNPLKLKGQSLTKTNDTETNASISDVELFVRDGITYYYISLFTGFDDQNNIRGTFDITPNTKCIEKTAVNSPVISVDSTIGFENSGTIYSGTNVISYTEKSINQFLGCVWAGEPSEIEATDNITSGNTYFGYENGDLSKKVELRITGVLSGFEQKTKALSATKGEIISVSSVGESIKNENSTRKEIFANSWIYNTSSTLEIETLSGTVVFKTTVDKSQLKKGDYVEIIDKNTKQVLYPTATSDIPYVNNVVNSNSVELSSFTFTGILDPSTPEKYALRRKINKSKSSTIPFKYGNDSIISDVQNLYVEQNTDDYAYVASNSLPSSGVDDYFKYTIDTPLNQSIISPTSGSVAGVGTTTIIEFDADVSFLTGDEIFYSSESTPLVGLTTGLYYVSKVNNRKIQLFSSKSFLSDLSSPTVFSVPSSGIGTHKFIISSQKSGSLNPQKIFKKFPLDKKEDSVRSEQETLIGSTGMLINGVEIQNYKTNDRIYYGPISEVSLLSGGSNYNIVNLPRVSISTSVGTNAEAVLSASGTITEVLVDPQDFDIQEIISIDITGLNAKGGSFKPVLTTRRREILFDGRSTTDGGGINDSTNQLTFISDHNLLNGEEVTYRNNGNTSISISGPATLINESNYFVSIENNKTILLYETYDDFLSGNNISFTSTSLSGTHKFLVGEEKTTLTEIKVIDGGSFSNRDLRFKVKGSVSDYAIQYKNHGLSSGELVLCSRASDSNQTDISLIDPAKQYYVIKVDDNSFRLADAGIGGTDTSNYESGNYVPIYYGLDNPSINSNIQQIRYPDLSVTVNYVSIGTGSQLATQVLNINPVIKGSIDHISLYETGTDYGSTTLNFENTPNFEVIKGSNAEITVQIENGSIKNATVTNKGSDYYTVPEVIITDPTNAGNGAKLRAVLDTTNNRISDVVIINPGLGYSTSSSVQVVESGFGAVFESNVRSLSVNEPVKLPIPQYESLKDYDGNLQYSVFGYFEKLRDSFQEQSNNVSQIIGWAYDGNPILGPYGISDPENLNSTRKTISSGYTADISNISNRPPEADFPLGFFVEDYKYDSSNGDLDEHNGRFVKTEQFPNGTYAYHATIDAATGNPTFPYFIGESYKSEYPKENFLLNQKYEFKDSNLIRNTFPYKISEVFADNDFIIETNEISRQRVEVTSISESFIDSIDIVSAGEDYKVGDSVNFENENGESSGIDAIVSSIKGESITQVSTTVENYNDAVFTKKSNGVIEVFIEPSHNLSSGDRVTISGFSTSILSKVNGQQTINVNTVSPVGTYSTIISSPSISTSVYVDQVPFGISAGDIVQIGSEELEILNVYPNKNILTLLRGNTGLSHTVGSAVSFKTNKFTFNENIDEFDSKVNKKVYFNPNNSVSVGVNTGTSTDVSYYLGQENINVSIPVQMIRIENHPFETNQELTFNRNGNTNIQYRETSNSTDQNLQSPVYVVKKSPNTIALKTSLTGNEIFFTSNGDNEDDYLFETTFEQKKGKVEKIISTVSISTSHNLNNNDSISLNVNPNLSLNVKVFYNNIFADGIDRITLSPSFFANTDVDVANDQISISDHGLVTGDKVEYGSYSSSAMTTPINNTPGGIDNNGLYYVFKVDDDTIKLCTSLGDLNSNPPSVVDITSQPSATGTQVISKVNPRITARKNNSIVFDLSNPSLLGYDLKIFYDKNFISEFTSTGSQSSFNINRSGTPGNVSANLTLTYDDQIPNVLYYALVDSNGKVVSADKDTKNYSEIVFENSIYTESYKIFNKTNTTFDISLTKTPESLLYTSSDCDVFEYNTTSLSSNGPVNKVFIKNKGEKYDKIPVFSGSNSSDGNGLSVIAKSDNIGNIEKIRIINKNFEYSSDPTLKPKSFISPIILLKDSNVIKTVDVTFGGSGYTEEPQLIAVNNSTRELINNGLLTPVLSFGSINSVEIENPTKGISDDSAEIFAVNNDNGISIEEVLSNNTGIFTCIITTPSGGFAIEPFAIGDEVFIEGIQKSSSTGDGFNSSDYGYKFFTIENYDDNVSGDTRNYVTINVEEFTSNTGIAATAQNSVATIINKNNYPTFEVTTENSTFQIGEKLKLNRNGVKTTIDLKISDYSGNILKVFGSFTDLRVGDLLEGLSTGNIATISNVQIYEGYYKVNYSTNIDLGWQTDVGKLSLDNQVLPDNNYYQNLSYSIKSSITWEDLKTPVNSLVHTSGLKNFSDTQFVLNYARLPETNVISVNREQTTLTSSIPAQSKVIVVENAEEYEEGDTITIGAGTDSEETNIIESVDQETGEIVLQEPTINEQPEDSPITVVTETEEETDNPPALTPDQEESLIDITKSLVDEKRVDTIYAFDITRDVDVFDEKSKFLLLKSKKLSDFTSAVNNRVLLIDNINDEFNASDLDPLTYKNIEILDDFAFSNYLFKVKNTDSSEIQLTNLTILNDGDSNFILEKRKLVNIGSENVSLDDQFYGEFSIERDPLNTKDILTFTPKDAFDTDYKVKYLKKTFTTGVGIGTVPLEIVDVSNVSKDVLVGQGESIVQNLDPNKFNSMYAQVYIKQENTNATNFVELYVTHDGDDTTFISESYFDNEKLSVSGNFIGSFGSNLDFGSNTFSLTYLNDTSEDVLLKSRIVGLGTTGSVGINSTYRFLSSNQPSGSERTFIYQSNYSNTNLGLSTSVFSIDKNLFDASESTIQVSIGQTKALHQVSLLHDGLNIYVQQSQFISAGSTDTFDTFVGLGTFGGNYTGTDVELIFYPDPDINGNVDIISLNECVYSIVDIDNTPNDLNFGYETDSVRTFEYFAINGDQINKKDFVLKSDETPIFAKTFDPNSDSLDIATNTFTIENHFFSENEELVYTPKSTFIGVSPTPIEYGASIPVPTTVYAINIQGDNQFQISDTPSGSALDITDIGTGNAHEFAMAKRNEKVLITLDNVAQYPLAYTKIQTTLDANITSSDTIFPLAGISSFFVFDILEIDDEYMKVLNIGFGTSPSGPITNTGTEPLVEVSRGEFGTDASSHTSTTNVDVYRGSYNIVGDTIYFADSPRGSAGIERDESNLVLQTSDFGGRVFLRSDYSTNVIYDDISNEFNGIGRTFNLTVGGANTTGIGESGGNGIVFINGIFQTPTTENNPNNNFDIIDDSVSGITTIVFTGITTDPEYPPLVSESDVNQNQIPRGGLIVSLGSTGGLGISPLVGASVTAVISGGVIQNSLGLGSSDNVGKGYNGIVSVAVTAYDPTGNGSGAVIEATSNVGAGGTLSFNVTNGGSNYSPETLILVSEPSYDNLEITGVSRIGVGATTEVGKFLLMNVEVGASQATGIGSTYFEVTGFNIRRSGYAFRPGDVFKPVGIVTDSRLPSLLTDFEITVLDTFTDNFGAWQFGELDYIDSIKPLQDGVKKSFQLKYNNALLSFEVDEDSSIDIQNSLLIMINGIIQTPGESYSFEGGTTFSFTEAPKPEDDVAIFFYLGTRGVDSEDVFNIPPSLKEGDTVQALYLEGLSSPDSSTQNTRTVQSIDGSNRIQTNLYSGPGINEDSNTFKLLSWTKQKSDKFVNGELVSKSRDSLLPQISPSSQIIKDFSTSDTEIFVENSELFTYDLVAGTPTSYDFKCIIVDGKNDPVAAGLTATISGGSVNGIIINDGGSGYTGSTVNLDFSASPTGQIATATLTVDSNGSLTTPLNITNPGSGYETAPYVQAAVPSPIYENIATVGEVEGFSGDVTSITSTTFSSQLALEFDLERDTGNFNDLLIGYPIVITNTQVSSGVISVDGNDSNVIGIGTQFLDNIYYIADISRSGSTATITCTIDSGSSLSGLPNIGSSTEPVGTFSWGRLYDITRSSNPISIGVTGNTFNVGLSTFPTIQRRGEGRRDTGWLI